MFFNNRHSLGTPTISKEGTLTVGTEEPAASNPARGGTGAWARGLTREETVEAVPGSDVSGWDEPRVLTPGIPNILVTLQHCKKFNL